MRDGIENGPQNPQDSAWLLGPTDVAAIRAGGALLDLLAAGERPDDTSELREVQDGDAR